MYYGLMQIQFDECILNQANIKDAKRLCLKIKSKYKVLASIGEVLDENNIGSISLYFSSLNSKTQFIIRTFEGIIEFCESSGFGRVVQDSRRIEAIDKDLKIPQSRI